MTPTLVIAAIYAAVLLGAGAWAMNSAPEGANAQTAIIVTGACAFVALALGVIAQLSMKFGALARARRAHLSLLIITIVFAAVFASRAAGANKATNLHDQAVSRFEAEAQAGARPDTPDALRAYLAEQNVPPHSKQYLANTLWTLCFISSGVFLALLVTRPKDPRG